MSDLKGRKDNEINIKSIIEKIKALESDLKIAVDALEVIANPKMSMYYAQLVDRAREALEKIGWNKTT